MRVLLCCLFLLTACQSPFLVFPGKALDGEIAQTDNFGFAKEHLLLKLETRPENPYSVFLRVSIIDSKLYVDAAPHRKWHQFIKENEHVKVQIGKFVYEAKAVLVDNKALIANFLPGRSVYQIIPI